MADNKKLQNELKALRGALNVAEKKGHWPEMVEACLAIIALGGRAPGLNVMVCLYYKDLGHAYMKLLEYEKALVAYKTARDGLTQFRATQKLKFPEDWLNELKLIERLIDKVERVHFKGVV